MENMVHPSASTAAPFSLRIVQMALGESLIVALPLPSSATMLRDTSPLDSPTVAATLPKLNRVFWKRLSCSPTHLTISTVLRSLGLRQVPNSKRIVFEYNNVIQLANAVAEVLKKLPTDVEELIGTAADFNHAALDADIAHLLYRFGNDIWGAKNYRPWLLQASEGIVEYQKDLVFGDAADQEVLEYYLRLWVLVKAFNSVRKSARSRSKNTSFANIDEQARRTSTRRNGESPLLPQKFQPLTPGSSFTANTDHVASPKSLGAALSPTSEPEELHIDSTVQMRRTTRTPKPRKDLVDIDGDSDESADELSELEEESSDERSRHYKGKGRVWKKTEAEEDPAFLSKEDRRSRKRHKSDAPSQETPKPRGRPPKRSGKETVSAITRHSVSAQGMSGQKDRRRLRRNYRSEGIIKNSSNESDGDNNIFEQATPPSRHNNGGKSARQPPGACESCRRRRQKCDRERPECGRCSLHGFTCNYIITPPSATPVTSKPRPKVEEVEAVVPAQSERDPTVQLTANGDTYTHQTDLPLDEGWDEDRWQYLHLQGSIYYTMLATMRSLGLRVTVRNRVESRIVIENYLVLCRDICQIAEKLCNKLSAAELIKSAADASYLDEDIDILFDDHSYIWSVDADRTKLLTAGSDLLYPKDLFYEDDDDRKLLWVYLHRWAFMLALHNCKLMQGAGLRKMNKGIGTKIPANTKDKWRLGSPYTFESPDDFSTGSNLNSNASAPTDDLPSGPAPHSMEDMFADPTLQHHETELLDAIGKYRADEDTEQRYNELTNAAHSDSIVRRPSRHQQKRKDSSITTPVQRDAIRPAKSRRIHRTVTNADDFTALFMSYLHNFADPEYDELAGLGSIEAELLVAKNHAARLNTGKNVRLTPSVFDVTMPAWLAYRRQIVETKRKVATMPPLAEAPSRQVAILQRTRLATQLRQTHEAFLEAGLGDARTEQAIYRAMVVLMQEHGSSQEAEAICRGFKGMEDELMSLGDQLMKEGGAKYVLGGAASVATLKDMQPNARVR